MSNLELQNVTKEFPGVTALKDVSFDVQDGEFFVLLGPTGAGKTTTLRVVAGLTKQDEGSILFDNEPVDEFPPAERDVALVFQQYSLYPTMSVYDNLAFPLRSPMRDLPEDEIRTKVEDVAKTLRIEHLVERKTAHLSGGEMQRVSIGRAMRVANAIQYGTVWVNEHFTLVSEMPHGGFKQSGWGKDQSMYAVEDYTVVKHVMINTGA